MLHWIEAAGSAVSILVLCAALFQYSVIRPLNQSLQSLQECIDHLKEQLSDTESKRQLMAERLSKVEEATDHVQHRLDIIERRQGD